MAGNNNPPDDLDDALDGDFDIDVDLDDKDEEAETVQPIQQSPIQTQPPQQSTEVRPANCPHCNTALAESDERFCPGCGLLIPRYVPPPKAIEPVPGKTDEHPALPRCPACGLPALPPRCRNCGGRIVDPND